jgi:hypothetical protein
MNNGPAIVFALCATVSLIGFVAAIFNGDHYAAASMLALFVGWTAHLRMEGR